MTINEYLKRESQHIAGAKARREQWLDSGANDRGFPERVQAEFNIDFITRLEALESLLNPPTE